MPRPKPINYNAPADLLERLPKTGIVTKGDKLAAFDALLHRADIQWRAARVCIFDAIRADICAAHRPQKDSAPASTRAPSLRAENRTEGTASIAPAVLERKV